jgi:hypothetical protein
MNQRGAASHARGVGARRWAASPTCARLIGVALAAALAAASAAVSDRATAAPTPFSLTFEGAHFADSTLLGGLRHDGRFTASAPFCSAGRAYDARHFEGEPLTVLRVHTCDDGSGSFKAFMPVVRNEHGNGTGTWKIVEGTGRYAALRGMGTYTSTRVSGDPDVFETITYRTSWQGVVDFDADPPAVETFTATARKLRPRLRTYVLRIGMTVRDTAAPVSYTLDVRAEAVLGFKQGSTASGQATITLRIRPRRATRSARILLTAQDALGNETSASRSVRLR